jgi:hypothetical protein
VKPTRQLRSGSWIDFFERGIPTPPRSDEPAPLRSFRGPVREAAPAPYWSLRDYAQVARTPAPEPR